MGSVGQFSVRSSLILASTSSQGLYYPFNAVSALTAAFQSVAHFTSGGGSPSLFILDPSVCKSLQGLISNLR